MGTAGLHLQSRYPLFTSRRDKHIFGTERKSSLVICGFPSAVVALGLPVPFQEHSFTGPPSAHSIPSTELGSLASMSETPLKDSGGGIPLLYPPAFN